MSYSIQNKLYDDVLGVILSFKGLKTKHHEQFDKCLNKISFFKKEYERSQKFCGDKWGAFKIIEVYWGFKQSRYKSIRCFT
tara:strand:+ start:45 stop:287 length:243 start_codon:yes stop_codon:yes gene_type:complete